MSITREKVIHCGRLLATFFFGQGATQALQLVTGFLLINWMSKDAYADYTLVLALMGIFGLLVDLGVSQTLVGLIGNKISDRVAVGRYLAACRYYCSRFLLLAVPALLASLIYFGQKFDWSLLMILVLWVCVSLVLLSQVVASIYKPLLLLEKRLKELYLFSVSVSSGRLISIGACYFVGLLTVPFVVLVGALRELAEASLCWRATRAQVVFPSRDVDISSEKKEVLAQSMPRVPSLLFTSFSGQFIVFAMSLAGTREGLAEVGALGRLGMLFIIFNHLGGVLVAPYFAKLDRTLLSSYVRRVLLLILAGVIFIGVFASVFPGLFLLILGDGYQHLKFEVVLVIIAALIRVSSMLLFSICLARKYVFPWYSVVDVLPQVVLIFAFVTLVDLGDLVNLLYFGIGLAVAKLLSKLCILYAGMRRELS